MTHKLTSIIRLIEKMNKIAPENYYKSNHSPYYIYGFDYNEKSSGIRVLHLLCHILNIHGFEAYIRANITQPDLWTPRLTEEVMQQHYLAKRKPIVIYPESVSGTPLDIGINVRYLLNVPGFIGGTTTFNEDELLFAYQKIFYGNTGCKNLLVLPASDPAKFKSNPTSTKVRSGQYFYYNRLLARGGQLAPMPDNIVEISPYKPRSLDELAEIFKSAELLYCYESSSIATEALLCGCPVVYMPNKEMLPAFPEGPFERHGAAWGDSPDEIWRAKNTVHKVLPRYLELFDEFHIQLTDFIKITQETARNTLFENCFEFDAVKKWGWPVIGDPKIYRKQPGTKIAPDKLGQIYRDQINKSIFNHTSKSSTHITVAIWSESKENSNELLSSTLSSLHQQIRKSDLILQIQNNELLELDQDNGWVLLLCAGDTLEPDALYFIEKAIEKHGKNPPLFGYFDHDEYCLDGSAHNPHFKPDFNYDLLLSYPYIGRSILVRNDLARQFLMNHQAPFDIVLAYKIALKAFFEGGAASVFHIPYLLAHLQAEPDTVFVLSSTAWQQLAAVLVAHLETTEVGATVLEGPGPGTFHVLPPQPTSPLVSIIIPTRDQLPLLQRCIESILEKTTYPNYEILIVDNHSQTSEAREYLDGLSALGSDQIRVLSDPGTFNFSRMNNLAVAQARGEFVLLLNNDTAVFQSDWLDHMVRQGLRDGVGIVGARLIYPDSTLQHAGIILGLRGPAELPCLNLPNTEPGYLFRAQITQNFSAVTAACLLVSKHIFQEVGGLDETTFGVSYNDVDFCLRVGQTGLRIVWTPLATLLHEGSASQKDGTEKIAADDKLKRFAKEQASMYQRWPRQIANDPAYNPNLSLVETGYEIETNPLLRFDKFQGLTPHRIAAFAADTTGCGHYRIFQPMRAMLDAGLCTGGASPEMMSPNLVLRSGADTLVFQRPSLDSDLFVLDALIPLKGIKKIYELDDNLAQIPIKSPHRDQISKDIRGRMAKAMGLCDRLVVSTEALAHELRGKNDDIRVVPNRLPIAMWGSSPPVKPSPSTKPSGSKPKVAWAGGIGHQGDIEMIAHLIRDLSDQVDWVFFGMCPEALKPFIREFHLGLPTLEYPKKLMELAQSWDLAIAPLEINPFNECKSNLKLLEYGWCGVPVVCSDVTPYQGNLPCKRVKNRFVDWRNAIVSMVSDLEACHREGLHLQKTVEASWMLKDDNLQSWYDAWTD